MARKSPPEKSFLQKGAGEGASRKDEGKALFSLPASFVTSVAEVENLPPGDMPEIAFAGRSNVGKSSLLNKLLGRKSLVKVGKLPGHTRLLNFFAVGDIVHLVDMPGYGYAKVAKSESAKWRRLIDDYLRGRRNLRLLCLLVDSRRGWMPSDEEFCRLLDKDGVGYLIVLTKCDKVRGAGRDKLVADLSAILVKHSAAYPHVFLTSAESGEGILELRQHLANVLDYKRG